MNLQEVIPKYKLTDFMPDVWINNFEVEVTLYIERSKQSSDYVTTLFSLLPFFLDESDSHWFFSECSKNKKAWPIFKMDFVKHFSNQYWLMIKDALCSTYDQDIEQLDAFVGSKIENLQALFPELHQSSIIKICCASVPEEYSDQLRDSIDQGLTMFKQRVKAIEKSKFDSLVAEQEVKQVQPISAEVFQPEKIDNMVAQSIQNFFVSDSFKSMMTTLFQPKPSTDSTANHTDST